MKVLSVRSEKLLLIVRILVYDLKIIGLAPFAVSVKTSTQLVDYQNTRIRVFRFSKIGLAYNLLLLILVVVWNALKLPLQCNLPKDLRLVDGDTIEQISWVSEKVLIVLSACIILASWGFRQDNAASIMNRLLEVDSKRFGLKEQPFDKRALTFLIVHVTLNGYLCIYLCIMELCYANFYGFLESCFNFIPYYIVHWFSIEYFTIIGLVARELQTVNKYLLNFEKFENYLPRPPVRSHALAVDIFLTPGCNELASLRLLRRVRTILFELCEDMAGFSSLPILLSIAYFFFSLLGQVYWLFAHLEEQREYSSNALINFAWILASLVAFVYPIVSLALNVTRTATEAGLTGHAVHKLLAVARGGSEIRQEVLGGIATYFIVLVQFHSTNGQSSDRTR